MVLSFDRRQIFKEISHCDNELLKKRPKIQSPVLKLLLCTEISRQGEKYLDKQIENAVNGVTEMKNVMEKSSDDRKTFLDALEKTKMRKEVTSSRATMKLFHS